MLKCIITFKMNQHNIQGFGIGFGPYLSFEKKGNSRVKVERIVFWIRLHWIIILKLH